MSLPIDRGLLWKCGPDHIPRSRRSATAPCERPSYICARRLVMPAGWRGCRSPRDTLWPCMNAVDVAPFVERRLRFAAAIGDAIAIIPGAQEARRNGDVNYEFRQQSDFFFLTGFDEPDAVAGINPADSKERYVLFVRPRDREVYIWNW